MSFQLIKGDALKVLRTLPDQSVQTCVTSPPYFGLRDYGVKGQIGLERTPGAYVAKLVEVFREVRRVLRDDGTCWANLGDSYAGSCMTGGTKSINGEGKKLAAMFRDGIGKVTGLKPKDLIGIPWRVAFALQADGWYLRSDIIWAKPNPMPESVRDRPTKAHEYLFLLSKQPRYYYDAEAIRERATNLPSGNKNAGKYHGIALCGAQPRKHLIPAKEFRNRRTVWTVTPRPYKEAHFATFPPKLIEPCILAGCREGGTVLDPFSGAGTTGMVALTHGRKYIGIELNPEYIAMTRRRIRECLPEPRLQKAA
jgi:DNA modification methylase